MTATGHRSMQVAGIGALFAASALLILHIRRRRQTRQSRASHAGTTARSRLDADTVISCTLPPHVLRKISKERRRKSKMELLSMKSPMYDNVFMLDPDRRVMCTISLKKAKWYVNKGIAEWSSRPRHDNDNGDPNEKCIRLLFEPNAGRGASVASKTHSETVYLRTPKQNVCVSCGSAGHHMRHYIVPYSYRTLLPEEYKSHMSHDIVILCPDCHLHVDRETKLRMNRIEHDLRDSLSRAANDGCDYWCSPVIDDTHLYHIRSCAIALVKWRDRMPQEAVESHEKLVREYLASLHPNNENDTETSRQGERERPLTKSQLQTVCGINYQIKNPDYITGSELVVKSLNANDEKIELFIKQWRQHFVDTVHPQYMPRGWSVENPVVSGRTQEDGAFFSSLPQNGSSEKLQST
eukprot:CCRYP_019319-RA/>CCRYP_019319-RA protein AED:0.46 eAED:0.43 QI:0/-1/0/1/-1/1/1/0/408